MVRLEKVLNITFQDVFKTSWECLEDVLKTFLQDVLAKRLEDVLKIFLKDILKMSWKRLEEVLRMYGQDEYIGLD